MVNNLYKSKVAGLIEKSKKRGLLRTYSEYCEKDEAERTALSKDEIIYYTSINKGETK